MAKEKENEVIVHNKIHTTGALTPGQSHNKKMTGKEKGVKKEVVDNSPEDEEVTTDEVETTDEEGTEVIVDKKVAKKNK